MSVTVIGRRWSTGEPLLPNFEVNEADKRNSDVKISESTSLRLRECVATNAFQVDGKKLYTDHF